MINIKRDPQIWGKNSTSEELKQHIYLTYGTISDEGIKKLLDDIHKLNSEDVFYDLGSGVGNVCKYVFENTNVGKCVGIEYDKDRYSISKELEKTVGARQMIFKQGNFFDRDWSDATVIFTDSIMFSDDTLRKMINKAKEKCKNLKYFISMKKLPENDYLTYIKTENIKVSWGTSTYNIYKTNNSETRTQSTKINWGYSSYNVYKTDNVKGAIEAGNPFTNFISIGISILLIILLICMLCKITELISSYVSNRERSIFSTTRVGGVSIF